MSSNGWTLGKLGDICEFKNGKKRPLTIGDYPIYGGNGILSYTNEYNAQNSIAIGRVGAYCGSVYLERSKFWISDNAILAKNNKKSDISFLYYLLSILQLNKRHIGTSQPLLTQEILNSIITCYPELNEQKAIAATLSCLDDMIELNNRTNQVLEEMAQAIFKRWFVDFEFPNEDGEPYKSSGGKMVDSELGEIPQGWRVKKVGDIFNISIGKTPPRKEAQWFTKNNIDIKWVSISDMGSSGVYIMNSSEYLTEEAIDNFNIKTVPENTVLLSFKLTVGRVAITNELMTTNEAIAHFVTDNLLINEFLYLYLKQFNFETLGNTSSIATAINSKVVRTIPIIMMDINTLERFHLIMDPIFKKIRINQRESDALAAIRDTLLPKLMSGEIRVPIGEVV